MFADNEWEDWENAVTNVTLYVRQIRGNSL